VYLYLLKGHRKICMDVKVLALLVKATDNFRYLKLKIL